MQQTTKAILKADWGNGRTEQWKVRYNPSELSFEKSAQFGEIAIPGLEAPLQQFVRGEAERMTVELFFDSTEEGMGPGAKSVTEQTDKVFRLIKVDGPSHAPAVVEFIWNAAFPGSSVEFPKGPAGSPGGNQQRNRFRGIVQNLRQRFTLFSSEGVPLRATLTLTLIEFRPLEEQLHQLGLSSPDRTHGHVLAAGDTLSGVAERYYGRPRGWRAIALENGLADPRRLPVGRRLSVPAIT
jgi:nucleoid-associated protein YgaU